MLLKHQYLKFAYVDIALVVSKMCRGNLAAGILAIGVTVVLIAEIDTNCRTNGRLSGGRNTEGNFYSCGVL